VLWTFIEIECEPGAMGLSRGIPDSPSCPSRTSHEL
jgi:hypothetical protein